MNLIIVGGSPRSGTTLVQNILDSHPAIYGGPEFSILPKTIELRRSLLRSLSTGLISSFLSQEQIDDGLRSFVMNLLTPLAQQAGASTVSEKTPGNILVLQELLELFPRALGVHVIRHPGAVLSSLLRVKARYVSEGIDVPERLSTLDIMARNIHATFVAGKQAKEATPDRVAFVQYEQLVRFSEQAIRDLCVLIGVDFRNEMLRPELFRHGAEDVVMSGTPWYTLSEFKRPISSDRLTAWQAELDSESLRALTAAFSGSEEVLAMFGYKIPSSPLSPTDGSCFLRL